MKVYKIDENNCYVEAVIVDEEIPVNCVEMQPPNGLYRAKWTGVEWIEDMSQAEIDELNNQPQEPTEIELFRLEQAQANAELFEMMLMLTGGGL